MLGRMSLREPLVGEALGRDQQDVDGVRGETVLDVVPFVPIARVDRRGPDAEPIGHRDLVAHERQQRADDQRGPWPSSRRIARRDPVDEALAPAGPLDDEGTLAVLGDGLDRLALALAERRAWAEHGLEMALEHVVGVDGPSVTGRRHPSITGSAAATRGWALVEPAAR